MPHRVVIAGGGQAGYQTAASLRTEGFDGQITIIGEEPGLPYQRPPLSKAYLLGKQETRHALLRPESFYQANRIDLRTGQRVSAIDRFSRRVELASGGRVAYDTLVLATGARNRILPIQGAMLDHVCYLRTLAEAALLRERLAAAAAVAVIGGGFIGLEAAAAARTLGKRVTVIEAQDRLMARVLAPETSGYFLSTHMAQDVAIALTSPAQAITPDGIVLRDGTLRKADLVVVGIGIVPNTELASEAGLATGNGIAVDEYLRTSDQSIFAIGDCAEYPSAFTGTRVRLESVQNAVDQAACVAKAIAGKPEPYTAAPWFWTDQFDIRLQIAGIASNWDQVVTRGNPESRKFSVFYFERGKLRAVDSINRPAEHLAARKLISARASISPQQAADEGFDLKMR
jgi:3-phenylpropionate/trans-cinnamate dioxygenase ferredoxin reductase subunit